MASEVKANKLSPSSGTALQIGDASDTITIPTGATFTITDGLPVASGGTGLASFTAGDILYATGSTTLAKLAKGTAEQVLSMNTGATAPEWATAAATAGGTGQTSFTAGDVLYANSTTTLTKLAKGTGLQGLQTNSGATAPQWADSPQSLMTAAGDVLYASGANTLAKLAKGSDTEVLTLASGVPSWAAAAGGGKINQVQYGQITDVESTTSTSYVTIANVDVDITPSASDSLIIILCFLTGGSDANSVVSYQLFRDTTQIALGDAAGSRNREVFDFRNESVFNHSSLPFNFQWVDNPGDTSAHTYSIKWKGATGTTYLGRSKDDVDSAAYGRSVNSIMAWELLA
jgi:hypothetical protein